MWTERAGGGGGVILYMNKSNTCLTQEYEDNEKKASSHSLNGSNIFVMSVAELLVFYPYQGQRPHRFTFEIVTQAKSMIKNSGK